ncbi:MAG: hypothetical protein OEY36_03670, partial [Gammaproteobacteria bacterium]|nr:hypothetical protein [Gammaproteobacteria bacterium]
MSVKCAEKNSRQLRLWLMLGLVLLVIFFWRSTESYKKPQITKLSAAPLHISGKLLEASDRAFGYRLLLFWLQQFDVQSGQYISYRDLDYQNLISWLEFLSKME